MPDRELEGLRGELGLLRRVIDNIPGMLAYWDRNLFCRFANRAYEAWFGVSPEELIGKHVRELLGPLYELNLPYIEGALRGEAQEFEREIPDPQGGPPRHSLASYVPDVVDGVVQGFFVLVSDVSELKRVELEQQILAEAGALLSSSLDYRRTLDSIARLVVGRLADLCIVDMLEPTGNVQRLTVAHADPANAWACKKLAARSVVRGQTLANPVLETEQPQVFAEISAEFWEANAENPEQLRALRALSPRSAMVVPLQSARGLLGALVFASSTPTRYDARALRFALELSRRAVLAIENARSYEAEQRATRLRDDVLAIVAHDVRSPLNAIQLAAGLLERQLVDLGLPAGSRSIQTILRSTERANRLIQDLLDTTRLEAGALSVSRARLSPSRVVADAFEGHLLAASSGGIELTLDLEGELPDLWVDRDRLLQVFENLLGNALKFTPARGRITMGARARPAEVLFWVSDTGAGIPAEQLLHVFDGFWQMARSERHGTGLGLPICRGIVEAHQGRIWVESVPGRGTTFYFTIPSTPPET